MAGSRFPDRDEVDHHRILALDCEGQERGKTGFTRGDIWHATLARNESPSTPTHPTLRGSRGGHIQQLGPFDPTPERSRRTATGRSLSTFRPVNTSTGSLSTASGPMTHAALPAAGTSTGARTASLKSSSLPALNLPRCIRHPSVRKSMRYTEYFAEKAEDGNVHLSHAP